MSIAANLYWNDNFENDPEATEPFILLDTDTGWEHAQIDDWKNQISSARIYLPGWLVLFSHEDFDADGSETWIQGPRDIPTFRAIFRAPNSIFSGGMETFNDECMSILWTTTPPWDPHSRGSANQWVAIYDLDTPLQVRSAKKGLKAKWNW